MSDVSWLNFVSVPAFAMDVRGREDAHIVFWNDAMEDVSDVSSAQAVSGRLPAFARRLMTAVNRGAHDAHLGPLGRFSFKMMPDNHLIATLIEQADQASDDERTLFLAMAAHDLRSPLRKIRHVVEDIRDGFKDLGDGKLDMLDMISDIGDRAHVLTNDVIAYTRATQGAPEKMEDVDLGLLADDVFISIDPLRAHKMTCAPMLLETDRIALQVTLRNLLDNAVRHGDARHIDIQIKVEAAAKIGALKFIVADSGKGFQEPATVFLNGGDFQSDSGFGLLGVRRLIEGRGGTIEARVPEKGSGSEIAFSLPGWMLPDAPARASVG